MKTTDKALVMHTVTITNHVASLCHLLVAILSRVAPIDVLTTAKHTMMMVFPTTHMSLVVGNKSWPKRW